MYHSDPVGVRDRPTIPLSAPHLEGPELDAIARAIESNWIAPIGPDVAAFEEEFCDALGSSAALATASGTAAIHLCLRVLGVGPGDEVLVSSLTFCASVNPVIYVGATPVFVDSEARSWNMDPDLLSAELERRGREGRLPAAVIVVHLYGQLADMDPILESCERWGVPIIEDAAEALGACHVDSAGNERNAGCLGRMGIFSFDGSKMITTSVGGMIVSQDGALVEHAKKLARQARERCDHYEHVEIGYNYRMSNLLAAMGRVQLGVLPKRVAARRAIFDAYERRLGGLPGVSLQPRVPWSHHNRWLSCLQLDPVIAGVDVVRLRQVLRERGVESRPIWKPMHLQPVYIERGLRSIGGGVSAALFENGLCLPSSSSMTEHQIQTVCDAVTAVLNEAV